MKPMNLGEDESGSSYTLCFYLGGDWDEALDNIDSSLG